MDFRFSQASSSGASFAVKLSLNATDGMWSTIAFTTANSEPTPATPGKWYAMRQVITA